VRTYLSLDLVEIFLVIGLVIPGLIQLYLGLRTWKKEWLAMETWVLALPYMFLFLFFCYFGFIDLVYPDLDLVTIVLFIVGAIPLFYFYSLGQILVLRGRRDVVMRGIQQILDNRKRRYRLEGDVFDLPEFKMKIEVNHFEVSDMVGIDMKAKDREWTEIIHEDILNLFSGRPSERYHPFLLVLGIVILGSGAALGALFAMS